MQERRLRILRVEGPAAHVAAARPAHHDRAGEHRAVARRGDVVREHVVGARDEVDELHLAHRAHAEVRRTRRGADDRRLGDRRVDHPRLAELREQAVGDLERAAVRADVLAEDEDVRVALHLLEERLADRLEIGDLSHRRSPTTRGARARPPRTIRPRGTRAAPSPADRRRPRRAHPRPPAPATARRGPVASSISRSTRASSFSSAARSTCSSSSSVRT